MKIVTWNVTTLDNSYHVDILSNDFRLFELDLLGISETHIPRIGAMKLGGIEFIYSDRKDDVHRQRIDLMMNKEASKFCLSWEGFNKRTPPNQALYSQPKALN